MTTATNIGSKVYIEQEAKPIRVVPFHNEETACSATRAIELHDLDEGDILFDEGFERWDRYFGQVRLSSRSLKMYRQTTELVLLPYLTGSWLNDFDPLAAARFLNYIIEETDGDTRAWVIRARLSSILTVLEKWGYIGSNPFREVRLRLSTVAAAHGTLSSRRVA